MVRYLLIVLVLNAMLNACALVLAFLTHHLDNKLRAIEAQIEALETDDVD